MSPRVLPIVALVVSLASPTSAFLGGPLPVIDPAAIGKLVQEIQQAEQLVAIAKQNIASLPAGVGLSNISGRISAVTGMLTQAQALCKGALAGTTTPSACSVEANAANAAAAQFGSETASLQSLQSLARGTGGTLAAQQAAAQATLEVATQLQELRQAQAAAALQKQIDGQTIKRTLTGNAIADPGVAP